MADIQVKIKAELEITIYVPEEKEKDESYIKGQLSGVEHRILQDFQKVSSVKISNREVVKDLEKIRLNRLKSVVEQVLGK